MWLYLCIYTYSYNHLWWLAWLHRWYLRCVDCVAYILLWHSQTFDERRQCICQKRVVGASPRHELAKCCQFKQDGNKTVASAWKHHLIVIMMINTIYWFAYRWRNSNKTGRPTSLECHSFSSLSLSLPLSLSWCLSPAWLGTACTLGPLKSLERTFTSWTLTPFQLTTKLALSLP